MVVVIKTGVNNNNLLRQYGLPRLTIQQINSLLTKGLITCEDICRYCYSLAVAGEEIWHLGAFEQIVPFRTILHSAQQSDERRRRSSSRQKQRDNNNNSSVSLSLLLDGIPISVKANLAVSSQPLTAGSCILGGGLRGSNEIDNTNYNPQQQTQQLSLIGYNATTTSSLIEHSGAVLIGITSMDEFGMGSLGTNNSQQRPIKNPLPYVTKLRRNYEQLLDDESQIAQIIKLPHDAILEAHDMVLQDLINDDNDSNNNNYYSPGGSSSGSGISVRHGSSIISLGSDTGGSIRLPASWCNIIGFKPSYGTLSRHGLVPYASSLDCVGILGPSISCIETIFNTIIQYQQSNSSIIRDSTLSNNRNIVTDEIKIEVNKENKSNPILPSIPTINPNNEKLPLQGLIVGIPAAFVVDECTEYIKDAWIEGANLLQSYGATVRHISNTSISSDIIQQSLATYYVLCNAEASSNLARYDGFRYGIGSTELNILNTLLLKDYEENGSSNNNNNNKRNILEEQYSMVRSIGFGNEVIRRILCGTAVLSSDKFHTYYEAATKLRAQLTNQLHTTLVNECHILLVPTSLFPPPKLSSLQKNNSTSDSSTKEEEKILGNNNNNNNNNNLATEMLANDIMTVPFSLAGLPALSIPIQQQQRPSNNGYNQEWPTFIPPALQLVAGRNKEGLLLQVASVIERANNEKLERKDELM